MGRNTMYFVQSCPTCGRHLQVRVRDLGRFVRCQHCDTTLVAKDNSNQPIETNDRVEQLLRMADQFLHKNDLELRQVH
jgi:DNA-directed RNA polymerase subunit M/transcription elongation factor TFIIS